VKNTKHDVVITFKHIYDETKTPKHQLFFAVTMSTAAMFAAMVFAGHDPKFAATVAGSMFLLMVSLGTVFVGLLTTGLFFVNASQKGLLETAQTVLLKHDPKHAKVGE
jgi:hypothetical protein